MFFMMKFKNLRLRIALFLGLLILLIPQVRANPVVVPMFQIHPFIMGIYLNFLFVATLAIEILIIKTFLKNNKIFKRSKEFYNSIFLVNLISYPMTQLFAFLIFESSLSDYDVASVLFNSILKGFPQPYIWLFEVFPIMLECVLFLKIFKKLNRTACFVRSVNNKMIVKSTITANLASFAFGFLTFFLFLI